jgi:hypothetical protein
MNTKQDEILRNDGHRGGKEEWNRIENVRKVRIRHGESVYVGRFAGRQGCFGTHRSHPVEKASSYAREGYDSVNALS